MGLVDASSMSLSPASSTAEHGAFVLSEIHHHQGNNSCTSDVRAVLLISSGAN